MGGWLLSIAAVVALSVLLDIIVPEGETNKYIKGIFAIFTIFVIIAPVVKFIDSGYSLENILNGENQAVTINTSFVDETNSDINNLTAEAIEAVLQKSGYNHASVRIYLDWNNKIDFVTVDINNLSIAENVPHININNDIKSIVSKYLNVDKERVYIHGYYTR